MGFSKIKIILLVLLLVSCGSKKKTVQRSSVKEVEVVNKDVVNKVENDITSNITLTHDNSKITIKPIDNTKPSNYNDNEFKNAEIIIEKSDKKETVSVVDKSTVDHRDISTKKNEINTSSVNKNVDIDRSWGVMDWLWLFIAIGVVILAIRLYIKKINPLSWLKNIIGIK